MSLRGVQEKLSKLSTLRHINRIKSLNDNLSGSKDQPRKCERQEATRITSCKLYTIILLFLSLLCFKIFFTYQ